MLAMAATMRFVSFSEQLCYELYKEMTQTDRHRQADRQRDRQTGA